MKTALLFVIAAAGAANAATLYDNGPWTGEGLVSSEDIPAYALVSEFADDFNLAGAYLVEDFHWNAGFYNGSPIQTAQTITIYYDNAGTPGAIAMQETFAAGTMNEVFQGVDLFGWSHFSYSVVFSAPQILPAGNYWVSTIVGPHNFPPQGGPSVSTAINGNQGLFRSAFFGFPNWTPGSNVFGVAYDWANFSVTGTIPAPASIALLGLGGLVSRRRR